MAVGAGCAVVVLVVEVEEDAEVVEDVESEDAVESEDVVDVVVCSAGSVTSSSDEQAASDSTATMANSKQNYPWSRQTKKMCRPSHVSSFYVPT